MSQITRAMEMVSAVKMRRAQQRVTASRPYSEQLRQIMSDLASQQPDPEQLAQFPLLQRRPIQNVMMIVVAPDRGLTGALNTNILRRATRFVLDEAQAPVSIIPIGKKSRDYFVKTKQNVVAEYINLGDDVTLDVVRGIVDIAIDEFVSWSRGRGLRGLRPLREHPDATAGSGADSAHGSARHPRGLRRLHLRAEPGRGAERSSCRATSRRSSTRRCSKAWPPSTRHAWSPCAAPRITPRRSCRN